jgi:hypothetical protein
MLCMYYEVRTGYYVCICIPVCTPVGRFSLTLPNVEKWWKRGLGVWKSKQNDEYALGSSMEN